MKKNFLTASEWFDEGQIHMRAGKYEESVKEFTYAMQAGWDLKVSHLSRGVANLLSKHAEKAYDDFTEVLMIDGMSSRAAFYRGLTSMNMGKFSRAAHDFTRALEIDPGYGAALLNRGVCLAQTGKHEEAMLDIKRAMMVAETDAHHFADMSNIWRTHLDGVLGVLHEHTDLSEDDFLKLRDFLER